MLSAAATAATSSRVLTTLVLSPETVALLQMETTTPTADGDYNTYCRWRLQHLNGTLSVFSLDFAVETNCNCMYVM